MSKKILSVLLALVFVMSTFAVSAFAATPNFEDEASEYTQTWGLNPPVENPDGTYTVEVTLKANYVAGAISFKIDGEGANLKDAVAGAAITYAADVEFNESGLVTIIPDASAEDSVGADLTAGGVVATLTYELTGASAILDLVNNPKTATNPDGTLIAVRLSNGNYVNGDMICGQPVVDKDGKEVSDSVIASVPLGAAQPADLAKKAGAEAGVIIDTVHTFNGTYKGVVYGFTQGANNNAATFMTTAYLTKNLEATNEGSLEIARPATAKTGFGTGTTITVKNSDGSVSCKYVVVIFGDVNGDSLINVNDIKPITAHISKKEIFVSNSVQMMAANCENSALAPLMHNANVNDIKPITTAIAKKGNVDQAALAAKMAGLTTNNYK